MNKFRSLIYRFILDENGSLFVLGAIALPVLLFAGAMAVDLSLLLNEKNRTQNAADNAVRSAAQIFASSGSTDTKLINEVLAIAGCDLSSKAPPSCLKPSDAIISVNHPPIYGNYTSASDFPNAIEVIIQRDHKYNFAGLLGFPSTKYKIRAVSMWDGSACIVSLGNVSQTGVTVGGGTVLGAACGVYSNSTGSASVAVNGANSIIAGSVTTVGSVSSSGSITGQIRQGISPIQYPFNSTCTQTSCATGSSIPSLKLPASGNRVYRVDQNSTPATNLLCPPNCSLSPGDYPNGLTVSTSGTVTLNPGVYYLGGSGYSQSGGGIVNASGVTFVISQTVKDGGTFSVSSANSTINLSPPTSGQYEGFAVIQKNGNNPSLPREGSSADGIFVNINGIIAVPDATFNYNASGAVPCLSIFAYEIQMKGTASIASGCKLPLTDTSGLIGARLVE